MRSSGARATESSQETVAWSISATVKATAARRSGRGSRPRLARAESAMATPPRAKTAAEREEQRPGRGASWRRTGQGDLEGHDHHVVQDDQQRREAVRSALGVGDPQGQADLEHGVVEEEDGLGGDVGEIGAVAPGTGGPVAGAGSLRAW